MQGKHTCLVVVAVAVLALGTSCEARSILCSSPVSLNSTELLPHPGSCALYLICDNGVPVLGRCPQGLHFNRDLQVCDWPFSAGCIQAMKKKHEEENAQKPEEEAQEQKPEEEAQEQTTDEAVTASDSP